MNKNSPSDIVLPSMETNAEHGINRQNVIVINSDSDEDENDPFEEDYFNQYLARLGDEPLPLSLTASHIEPHINRQYMKPFSEVMHPPPVPTIIDDPDVLYQLYLDKVLEVFPDVCRDHMRVLYGKEVILFEAARSVDSNNQLAQSVIIKLVEDEKYPKESEKRKMLKRKRTTSEEDEDEATYRSPDRPKLTTQEILEARILLLWEFVNVPLHFIDRQLKQSGNLYLAYEAIEVAERDYDQKSTRIYQRLAKPRKPTPSTTMPDLTQPEGYKFEALKKELLAARRKREKGDAQRREKRLLEEADAALMKESLETGNMVECQCCFTDTPMPKATSCIEGHFFCLDCALSHAKARIEISRYDITCMDGSGCKAEFSRYERSRFLTKKLEGVLERLQQQADLLAADLDGLDSCPFCDFAAICPPIEIDKEFRCQMPDCEAISCRLCRAISHLPMTCEEWKKEQGVSERHIVEEAMTKALIRECPKCKVPILKDGGCNKLICSKCRCYVCDYCGKDISKEGYSHFDMGGPAGGSPLRRKCPSTDATALRNDERVQQAEKEAMEKVRAENPELSEEDLKVKFSAAVAAAPQTNGLQFAPGHPVPLQLGVPQVIRGVPGRPPARVRPPRPAIPVRGYNMLGANRDNANLGVHIGHNHPGNLNQNVGVQGFPGPIPNNVNPLGNPNAHRPNRPGDFPFDEPFLDPPPYINGRAGGDPTNINHWNFYMGIQPRHHARPFPETFPAPMAPMRPQGFNQPPPDYGYLLDATNAPNVVPVDYTGGPQGIARRHDNFPPDFPMPAPKPRRRDYDGRWD